MEGVKNDQEKLPLGIVIQRQFPNALKAIAECSLFGHNEYKETDTDYLNYQRLDNPVERYTNAMQRHFIGEPLEAFDKKSKLPHIYHTAWNALARLETYILENREIIKTN